ncbi:protein NRT1/ PTR FAMILY 5.6-like [Macadamia integrifolia]|uniref:protein NRT1/ PTR FAMILY 5.6-like n=1 Tax=Macadamia integrifolia TaxID=60698 RepID=UPI001C528C9B|nr:protein NRT1/ PTR FAMILY 5.6-like [Macadamia integrifolia]
MWERREMQIGPRFSLIPFFAHLPLLNFVRMSLSSWMIISSRALISIAVLGLVFAQSMVKYGIMSILMVYLTDDRNLSTSDAAVTKNVGEGVGAILKVVMAHITYVHLNRFHIISSGFWIYTMGLYVLYDNCYASYQDPNTLNEDAECDNTIGMMGLYTGLVCITIGSAGQESRLKEFVLEQFKGMCGDKERAETIQKLTWFFGSVLGIIVAIYIKYLTKTWDAVFEISCLVMGGSLLFSLSALKWYHYGELTETSLNRFLRAMVAVLLKGLCQDPLDDTSDQLNERDAAVLDNSDFCRWLDKAAMAEPLMSMKEQENNWRVCTETEVKEAKVIISTVPIWPSMLLYGLVKATGSTFFIDQASNLQSPIFNNIDVAIVALYVIQSLSTSAICGVYKLLPKRLRKGRTALIRIGAGLFLTIICFLIAWRVEIRRLSSDNGNGMSIFWVVPQFCLLGFMEGLTEVGIQQYISEQVSAPERSDSPTASDLMTGIGTLLGAVLSLAFSKTLDQSQFDKYYMVMMIVSGFNFFLYCSISTTSKFLMRYKTRRIGLLTHDHEGDDHSTDVDDDVEASTAPLDRGRKRLPIFQTIIKILRNSPKTMGKLVIKLIPEF